MEERTDRILERFVFVIVAIVLAVQMVVGFGKWLARVAVVLLVGWLILMPLLELAAVAVRYPAAALFVLGVLAWVVWAFDVTPRLLALARKAVAQVAQFVEVPRSGDEWVGLILSGLVFAVCAGALYLLYLLGWIR